MFFADVLLCYIGRLFIVLAQEGCSAARIIGCFSSSEPTKVCANTVSAKKPSTLWFEVGFGSLSADNAREMRVCWGGRTEYTPIPIRRHRHRCCRRHPTPCYVEQMLACLGSSIYLLAH